MHDIIALKEMLCDELEEYGRKGEMSAGTLEIVDKLAHAVKNLGKIVEMYEDEEYSMDGGSMDGGSMDGGSYARGGGNRGGGGGNRGGRSSRRSGESNRSYESGSYAGGGRSYARGRGQNARRDSMGRYSRDSEELVEQLEEMMESAPDEETRMELKKLIKKMKNS